MAKYGTEKLYGNRWIYGVLFLAEEQGLVPVGTVILFTGNVAEPVELTYEAKITVKSDIEIFNRQLPRNLYQPGCQWTLYDSGCGLNKASWATVSSISATSTKNTIQCGISAATGYYDLGVVEFTSGILDEERRTIKSQIGGEITLSYSLVTAPEVGDGVILWAGCDKKQTTCTVKGNLPKFRGFPFVPKPENAY